MIYKKNVKNEGSPRKNEKEMNKETKISKRIIQMNEIEHESMPCAYNDDSAASWDAPGHIESLNKRIKTMNFRKNHSKVERKGFSSKNSEIGSKPTEDDFYTLDEKNYCIIGQRKKRKYQLGDEVKIKVKRVDLAKRQIDFSLIVE